MLQNSAKAIVSPGGLARTQSAPDRSESDGSSASQLSFLRQVKYARYLLVRWWDETHQIHICFFGAIKIVADTADAYTTAKPALSWEQYQPK